MLLGVHETIKSYTERGIKMVEHMDGTGHGSTEYTWEPSLKDH